MGEKQAFPKKQAALYNQLPMSFPKQSVRGKAYGKISKRHKVSKVSDLSQSSAEFNLVYSSETLLVQITYFQAQPFGTIFPSPNICCQWRHCLMENTVMAFFFLDNEVEQNLPKSSLSLILVTQNKRKSQMVSNVSICSYLALNLFTLQHSCATEKTSKCQLWFTSLIFWGRGFFLTVSFHLA